MKKVCTSCGIEKQVDSFHVCAKNKDGLYPWCKDCVCQKNREYYLKNSDRIRKQVNIYRLENKDIISKYLSKNKDDRKEKRLNRKC